MQATAKTAQIFLGLQVQCTQCHNHPFNEWKQNQFWELNAFFRQTQADASSATRRNRDMVTVRAGEPEFRRRRQSARRSGAVLRAAQRHDEGGLSGVRRRHEADKRQRLSSNEVDRRTELAKLVVDVGVHAQGDRQPHVGAFPRLRLHQAGRRHGSAQPADASGIARRAGRGVPPEQLRPEEADPLDRAERALFAVEPFQRQEQEGRSVAGRKADVQPLLSAADAGRRAVRIAADGHRGRTRPAAATKSRKRPRANGWSSSPSPSAPTTTTRPRPSTARFRRC